MIISIIALQMSVEPAAWGETFGELPILLYKKGRNVKNDEYPIKSKKPEKSSSYENFGA